MDFVVDTIVSEEHTAKIFSQKLNLISDQFLVSVVTCLEQIEQEKYI